MLERRRQDRAGVLGYLPQPCAIRHLRVAEISPVPQQLCELSSCGKPDELIGGTDVRNILSNEPCRLSHCANLARCCQGCTYVLCGDVSISVANHHLDLQELESSELAPSGRNPHDKNRRNSSTK